MKRIFAYTNLDVEYDATENNTHIELSFSIKKSKDMKKILEQIRSEVPENYVVHVRTLKSQIREWRAHNLLYALHIQRHRTEAVDLDYEPSWRRFGYFILSCLYPHF